MERGKSMEIWKEGLGFLQFLWLFLITDNLSVGTPYAKTIVSQINRKYTLFENKSSVNI